MKKYLEDFKAFAIKGNVIDLVRLAVGMERVAVDMEHLGGFGELAAKGRELRETALIARGWAGGG